MKRIALLATGGTIASVESGEGLAPGINAAEILSHLPSLAGEAEVVYRDVFSLDSSNIQPEEWRILARAVFDALKTADAAVITHGTDTMAYSAAALSFMLQGVDKPVVFTGSQLPLRHPFSDGPMNLNEAMLVARTAPAGVYVVFNHNIIPGTHAVKLRTTSFDAFGSVNARLAGYIDADGAHYHPEESKRQGGDFVLRDEIDHRVFLLKLMPGTDPGVFDWIAQAGMKGVVVEAFGLGGLHYIRRNLVDKLKMLSEKGIYTLVTTQCLYEKTDFSIYEVGRNILSGHVFSGRDMTSEAAVTKLMWVLGDPENRIHLLEKNICGEMTEHGGK